MGEGGWSVIDENKSESVSAPVQYAVGVGGAQKWDVSHFGLCSLYNPIDNYLLVGPRSVLPYGGLGLDHT